MDAGSYVSRLLKGARLNTTEVIHAEEKVQGRQKPLCTECRWVRWPEVEHRSWMLETRQGQTVSVEAGSEGENN